MKYRRIKFKPGSSFTLPIEMCLKVSSLHIGSIGSYSEWVTDVGLTAHQHKKTISRRTHNKTVRLVCIKPRMNARFKKRKVVYAVKYASHRLS